MATLSHPNQQLVLRALTRTKTALLRAERAFLRNTQPRPYLEERLNEITKWSGIVRAILRQPSN